MFSNMLRKIILFSSFILRFLTQTTCCPGISNPRGNMTQDLDVEFDSPIRIRCSLFQTQIKHKKSTFNVSSKNLQIEFHGRLLDNAVGLDELTAEYYTPYATFNDIGQYICYISIPNAQTRRYVCSTHVSVGYKPLPVENFSCVVQESRKLICKWEVPFNPVKTDYALYNYFYRKIHTQECPEEFSVSGCQWAIVSKAPYITSRLQLSFLIVGYNSLGRIKQYFTPEHYKIGLDPKKSSSTLAGKLTTMQWNLKFYFSGKVW